VKCLDFEDIAKKVTRELEDVLSQVNRGEIQRFVDVISKAKRVFVVGVGREGLSSRAFAMRLMHLGKTVHWVWDDTTPAIGEGDLLIATSGGGNIPIIHHVVVESKKAGAKIAVVTAVPEGETPRLADIVLSIPACVYRGRGNLVPSIQPMGSLFEQAIYIVFDIVVLLLADIMGITPEEMESRHRNVE
jgi:6-phospho-3-hexuloisomerase